MRLEPLLSPERTAVFSGCDDLAEVLARIAEAAAGELPGIGADALRKALEEREGRYPTSTPEGVGFPHALLEGVERTVVVVAKVTPGVEFRPGEHPPVDLVFGMIGSADHPYQHVQILARIARIVRAPGALERLRACTEGEALLECLVAEDRSHA